MSRAASAMDFFEDGLAFHGRLIRLGIGGRPSCGGSRYRIARGEDRRLDAAHPFAPAQRFLGRRARSRQRASTRPPSVDAPAPGAARQTASRRASSLREPAIGAAVARPRSAARSAASDGGARGRRRPRRTRRRARPAPIAEKQCQSICYATSPTPPTRCGARVWPRRRRSHRRGSDRRMRNCNGYRRFIRSIRIKTAVPIVNASCPIICAYPSP